MSHKKAKSWIATYDVVKELGEGGNATVFLVKDKNTGKEYALKELQPKRENSERKARFSNEIEVLTTSIAGIKGILPIDQYSKDEYWYTMPVATPIMAYINEQNLSVEQIVLGTIELCKTLEELHKINISHRDIKPSNIYFYDNQFSLGDFGLVDFPESHADLTKSTKGVGAIFTIAPEMKRNPKESDGKKGDIFSLAKTLWMLLSNDEKGFDGVYEFGDPSYSLRYTQKCKGIHLVEIEELLHTATDNNPDKRPSISEFKNQLQIWLDIFSNPKKSQESDWNFLKRLLFGNILPDTVIWKNIDEIVNVLNIIGTSPAYNHMLFHDEGGLDFLYAEKSAEEGCIRLYVDNTPCYIVKPLNLRFEGFSDYRWNYFLLELANLNPIFPDSSFLDSEPLIEDSPAHYVSAQYAQYGVYDYDSGVPLPPESKSVLRCKKGTFLIVMKMGFYNRINSTYDGRHGLCTPDEFRKYIEALIAAFTSSYNSINGSKRDNDLSDYEIEYQILNDPLFCKNPFSKDISDSFTDRDILQDEALESYILQNFVSWNFKSLLPECSPHGNISFGFRFVPSEISSFDTAEYYFNKDGLIESINTFPSETIPSDIYLSYDRPTAFSIQKRLESFLSYLFTQQGYEKPSNHQNFIVIEPIRYGNPTHLFRKEEIKFLMQYADDRVDNRLVIDEDGYAKIIAGNPTDKLYPVCHSLWHAGNLYVGKYSSLSVLDDTYLALLQGWQLYLETGHSQFTDDFYDEFSEDVMLENIKKFYNY